MKTLFFCVSCAVMLSLFALSGCSSPETKPEEKLHTLHPLEGTKWIADDDSEEIEFSSTHTVIVRKKDEAEQRLFYTSAIFGAKGNISVERNNPTVWNYTITGNELTLAGDSRSPVYTRFGSGTGIEGTWTYADDYVVITIRIDTAEHTIDILREFTGKGISGRISRTDQAYISETEITLPCYGGVDRITLSVLLSPDEQHLYVYPDTLIGVTNQMISEYNAAHSDAPLTHEMFGLCADTQQSALFQKHYTKTYFRKQ